MKLKDLISHTRLLYIYREVMRSVGLKPQAPLRLSLGQF